MPDPHNTDRYGELWPQHKIDWTLLAIEPLKPYVVLSGGFAWHFLSPEGHSEYKHAHDHKDVDIYIPKRNIATVMGMLPGLGFRKVNTQHDGPDFRRYEDEVEDGDHPPFRITLDLFDGDVESIETPSGWKVVRPDVLLSFYKTHHTSVYCWAVQSATRLFANGEVPENLVGNGALMACPDLDVFICTKCGWGGQFPFSVSIWDLLDGASKAPICNGCRKYVVLNLGKPSYTVRRRQ